MAPLIISHTPAEGTRLHGAEADGPVAEVLKGAGWKQRGGGWHLPRSAAHTPRLTVIRGTAARLERVGVDVVLELGGAPAERAARLGEAKAPADPLELERRVRLLEARRRKIVRSIAGYVNQRGRQIRPASGATRAQLDRELVDVDLELARCRDRAAELVEQGESAGLSKDHVRHGDEVQHAGHWLRTIRVTRHSITTQDADGKYRRLAYAEITAVRTPAEALRGERPGA